MNLHFHLSILINFQVIKDCLLLHLELLDLFLIVFHHQFLLELQLLYIFLKVLQLRLKLALKRFELCWVLLKLRSLLIITIMLLIFHWISLIVLILLRV